MADFSFASLTTAVVGIASTEIFQVQSESNFTISPTIGSISVVNISGMNMDLTVTSARPGWLTGRRPQSGQIYPRGVYNK